MALKQTIELSTSLPRCAGIFRAAGDSNSPDWVIVHFHVPPDEAEITDMKNVSETFPNRTKALTASGQRARALRPKGTEDGHTAVWRIEQDGNIYWRSVMPLAELR